MSRNDGLGATVGGTTPERWGLEATGPSLPWEGRSYRFLDQKAEFRTKKRVLYGKL